MKDFISLIKIVGSNMSKIFKLCQKEKETEVDIDVMVGVAETGEHSDKISKFTVTGIFAVIVSFYQVKQLFSVDFEYKNLNDFSFITFISNF